MFVSGWSIMALGTVGVIVTSGVFNGPLALFIAIWSSVIALAVLGLIVASIKLRGWFALAPIVNEPFDPDLTALRERLQPETTRWSVIAACASLLVAAAAWVIFQREGIRGPFPMFCLWFVGAGFLRIPALVLAWHAPDGSPVSELAGS